MIRILLLLFVCPVLLTSQNNGDIIERTYGGSKLDRGVHISPAGEDGYLIVGYSNDTAAGDEDVYLIRIDGLGKVIWERRYPAPGNQNGWHGGLVPGGNYYIAGTSAASSDEGNNLFLMEIDSAGEMKWRREYEAGGDDWGWSAVRLRSEGYVMVGDSVSKETESKDAVVIRVDDSGELIWLRTFGGPGDQRLFSVVEGPDGSIYSIGLTNGEGNGEEDTLLLKVSPDGNLLWRKTFGGSALDIGHGIILKDDALFITGYTANYGADGHDPLLLKVTFEGELVWSKVYKMAGTDHAISGCATSDGGFAMTGFSQASGDLPPVPMVIKLDESGALEWTRQFPSIGFGMGYTITPAHGGGIAFTGHVQDQAGNAQAFFISAPLHPSTENPDK